MMGLFGKIASDPAAVVSMRPKEVARRTRSILTAADSMCKAVRRRAAARALPPVHGGGG